MVLRGRNDRAFARLVALIFFERFTLREMAERPKDLVYSRDEKPPAIPLIALGFQHVAVICPYLVMVALVAEAARLPQAVARNAMGLAMIAVAFLTVLQSLRLGRIGSGYLCPPVVSAIYLPSAMRRRPSLDF
jgi:NCS2 family nucleobase:cation symporter-2